MNKVNIPYISIYSHELKSPLNAIFNLAKLIQLNLDKPDEEKVKKYLSLIVSQTLYMKNYISNTIELGKLQIGKELVVSEEFDLVEIMDEIAEVSKILIENRNIEIKTLFPVDKFIIKSDPLKIKQILMNIASNSAKYTKNGYILFSFQKFKNQVIIMIQDTGKGILKEDFEKIFNPYCSLESLHEKFIESTGLGLYITKELLNLIGGNILIESEYGKGTTVYISIPYKIKK